ncbi:MAG: amidohydrolase family protein [Solirubrobacterales bacterium]|nr:amidohydrolase family protein [Solirubrobacterales bacterium]
MSATAPSRYALTGRVLDGTGDPPIEDGVLLVEGQRIAAVGPREDFPELEGEVIDCAGGAILPGLVNSHLHLALDGDDTPYPAKLPRLAQMRDRELIPLYLEQARINLEAGITTVRDLHPGPGGTTEGMLVAQELLRRGEVAGSRVHLALRPLVMAGGHGTQWLSRVASGPEDVRRAARENVAEGSQFLKLMTAHSWGPLPGRPESWRRYFTVAELAAAVDAAHRAGIPVAAHSHGVDSIGDNLEAGVDSIEHGSGLTEELVTRMVDQGTFLVPTLASYASFIAVGPERGAPAGRVEEARYVHERQRSGMRLAIEAGVKIAAGTDAGFQYLRHGATLVRELELYVELGMTPLDAIGAATLRGAEILQVADRLGSLEAGKIADVIVVDGDPLADVGALRAVKVVIREGRIILPPDRGVREVAR